MVGLSGWSAFGGASICFYAKDAARSILRIGDPAPRAFRDGSRRPLSAARTGARREDCYCLTLGSKDYVLFVGMTIICTRPAVPQRLVVPGAATIRRIHRAANQVLGGIGQYDIDWGNPNASRFRSICDSSNPGTSTVNPRTKNLDFRGFDSSRFLS